MATKPLDGTRIVLPSGDEGVIVRHVNNLFFEIRVGDRTETVTRDDFRLIPTRTADRKKLESLAWTHAHKDKRGKLPDGSKTLLHNGGRKGTILVSPEDLTTDQLLARLPRNVRESYRFNV